MRRNFLPHLYFTKITYFVTIFVYNQFIMAHVDITSQEQFDGNVLGSQLPVIVDFWADWCGPCHMLAPTFEELSDEYSGKVTFAKLDVDALPDIAAKLGVQSIPTTIIFKDGKETLRIIGAHPKHDYVQALTNLA